jgi:hypothetical protein
VPDLILVAQCTVHLILEFVFQFAGGGNTTFGGMWNMLVHVLMYGYYFLAAAGVRWDANPVNTFFSAAQSYNSRFKDSSSHLYILSVGKDRFIR